VRRGVSENTLTITWMAEDMREKAEPLLFASSQVIGNWEEENRAPNMPFIL
jgi:hypothetical protein